MRLETRSKRWLALIGALLTAGCSPPTGSEDDSGTPADSGNPVDSGTAGDAGDPNDAGSQPDAGSIPDAGSLPDAGMPADGGLTIAERTVAASTTAQTHALCIKIKPFYWEIGDQSAALGSGSVDAPDGGYTATSVMPIASASKWLYSTYFVQKTNGVLSASDIQFFNFWSGYTDFTSCPAASTVGTCLDKVNPDNTTNGTLEATTQNKFFYSGGHMQKHAALNGLAAMGNAALATEIRSQLGTDVSLFYFEPQLAGGVATSAAEYAKVLRKILSGQLVMKTVLGTHAVCTDPTACNLALYSPLSGTPARDLQFHYSIGHWVEDDPAKGDGAFSSAGSFGFYPWIDATQTIYGIVARHDSPGSGFDSVDCGSLIRKAWVTGLAQ